ncbi:MAG TPA: hypothetical protein VK790_10505 [Solirubrobacteraceae bacterium]|jgi:hypothetical protein|nr:hypothetical protein [Solirubrobacteraceae bacterium]
MRSAAEGAGRRYATLAARGAVPGALAAALVLALAGCGIAVGPAPTAVKLLVTREFGSRVVQRTGALRVSAGETVMELLRRNGVAGVSTGAVASVFVNGVRPAKAVAAQRVHPGDHIWLDLHDGEQAQGVPAVVGSFPEPFVNGVEGKRWPVRIECASVSSACAAVTASLRAAGAPAAVAAIGSGSAPETLRVMVGPWSRVGSDVEAQSIARGPATSGVYALLSAGGRALTLLDRQGRPVRTLRGDAGLLAATTGSAQEAPVWVVTGTDEAGVELAARAFDRRALEDRFAVALAPGATIALPAPPP